MRVNRTLVCGMMLAVTSAAFADVVTTATLVHDFSTADTLNNGTTDDVGDNKINPPSGDATLLVGERDVAGAGNQYLARLIMRFNLPSIPANMTVQSATLNLTPVNTGTAANWIGNSLQLWHSTSDNATGSNAADPPTINGYRNRLYDDATYSNSGITVINGNAMPAVGNRISLNVTSLVQDDYNFDIGQAVASFRIQLPSNYVATWDAANSVIVLFAGDGNTTVAQRPTLSVTFTPVPEAATLPALMAGAGLLSLRRR